MAKKKAAGPQPGPRGKHKVALRCGPLYHAWVYRLGDKVDRGIPRLLMHALRKLAEEEGFDKPPDRWD